MAKGPPAFLKKASAEGPKGKVSVASGPSGKAAIFAKKAAPPPPAGPMPAFKKGGKVKK
jgi:hypothetical protein